MRIQLERFVAITATPQTTWIFAVFNEVEGGSTTVEITFRDRSDQVVDVLADMVEALASTELRDEGYVEESLGLTRQPIRADPAIATAVSGLRSAAT